MSGAKIRRETAAIADLVVADATGTDWITADAICQRAGIPRTQGRRTAARLAKVGVLQRREVEWVSGKSRTRRRFEYRRIPEERDGWVRLPTRLEPAWHPVDCSKARRIVGRNSFSKEHAMISEQELFEMPSGVRERFKAISDDDFADHPEVATLRARLADLEAEHREAAHRHTTLNVKLGGLIKQAEWARGEVSRLADGRPRRLAEILLSGDHDLAQDRAVLGQIADLQHFSDAVALATPAIERIITQASANTQQIVSSLEGQQDALRGLLDHLKLAEAKRQTYA